MPFATPALDLELFRFFNQSLRSPLLDAVMPALSSALLMWSLALALMIPVFRRQGKRAVLCFLLILAVAGVSDFSCKLLKDSFGRVRPLNALAEANYREDGQWRRLPADFVQEKERGSSFPSAHASTSMAAAVLAMLLWPRSRPWLLLLPLLVGWSRLYLGKHYPTDVLGGWLLGLAIAGFAWQGLTALERALGKPGWISAPRE